MRIWYVGLVLALVAVALAGCGAEEATPATADEGSAVAFTSEALDIPTMARWMCPIN